MKITPESLSDFLAILPQYDRLSLTERRALASIERPSQSCSLFILGAALQNLTAAGFVLEPVGGRCSIPPTRQEFIRTLRILRGHPVFQSPGQTSFGGYVTEHFTVSERDALRHNDSVSYGERNLILYRQVTLFDWVKSFLDSKNGDWHELIRLPRTTHLPDDAEVFESARKIVRWLISNGGRVTIRELPALTPTPELLSAAIHMAFRNLLLFCAVDSETMEVQLGIWPGVLADPALAAVPAPQHVTPTETFEAHFLMEDMVMALVACATEPILLRSTDGGLYVNSVRTLARTLNPLPKWVDQEFNMDPETRIHASVSYLFSFLLVEVAGHDPPRMTVTSQGREWLKLSAGDRLRVLVDGILNRKQSIPPFRDFAPTSISPTGVQFRIGTHVKVQNIDDAIMQPIRALGDGFFPAKQVADFSQMTNPLLEVHRKDKNAYITSDNMYLHRPDADQLREAWSQTVHVFVRARLLPLGAARVGHGKEGLSIAITPVGRYFLGQSKEWQWTAVTDAQVIVQPNFEVTFLGEAPVAETEIGSFAERRSHKMGALFQITKKAIFAAAVAGMTAESVLEVLDRVSTRPVPANVRREVQGWFAQCRKVSIEPTVLIRCPDAETALRVVGIAKGFVTPVTDTILEYRDPGGRQRLALIKKLKELGMLVTTIEEKTPINRGYHRDRW